MSSLMVRKFTSDDVPQIMALQQAYKQVFPHATIITGEVYLSPGFANGENIICALDENRNLQGYAPIFPNLTENPQIPQTIWAEVKVNPELASPQDIKDLLFEQVIYRTREITRVFPRQRTQLTFQYHPSELPSIEYVMSRGCVYTESVFRMMRDLSQELSFVPPPSQIDVRPWRMESEEDQRAYVQARNEAFPEALVALEDWQSFLASSAWHEGTSITAFSGNEIVGSVTVYWDDVISQQLGRKAGFTEYIFVRSTWRKRGIAPFMINQGLIYLKEHGREVAFLEVKASNQHALDLYYGLGYQLIDESRLYVLEF